MRNTNKTNVIPVAWKHHLEGGGWEWVCSEVIKQFHNPRGKIKMYMAYEYQIRDKIFEPHIAWFHQVLSGPERCLNSLVKSTFWENNTKYLLHAVTVSEYQEKFLREHGVNNVSTILHPTPLDVPRWNLAKFRLTKNVYHIGFHCRDIDFFRDVASKVEHNLMFNYLIPKENLGATMPQCIKIVPRVRQQGYEEILQSSVVFMHLSDTTANNTVLECVARGTPILVNPVGGIKEYLGDNYPLYYNSPEDAVFLLENIRKGNLLEKTHDYLLNKRNRYSIKLFINRFNRVLESIDYEI